MHEIKRVLRKAAFRLFVLDLIRTSVVAASAALAALILLRVVQQVFGLGLGATEWISVAAIAAGVAALGTLAWSLIRKHKTLAVARELDERANLRESLSTALCVARQDDPWCRAVVETARDRATRVVVKDAIPYQSPRFWPAPLALALAFAIIWYTFPIFDVLGLFQERAQAEERDREIKNVNAEINLNQKKLDELLAKAKLEVKPDQKPEGADPENPEALTPEAIRSAAVKKLTSLQDKLNEARTGEKAQKMDAIRQAMKQLKQPGPGPLDNLSKSLAQGNFKQAQDQLDEVSKKLAEDSMSAQDKEQMKQQLAKLSEQMQKLGEDRKALEQKLEQAGLSPEDAKKLAADPEALKQALEKMQNLTEEQKKQLQEAAKSQCEACKQCSGMGSQLGKMASGMGKEGMNKDGAEGMEAMAGMLSDLEMMNAEMDSLDAAMKECSGQLCRLGEGLCQGKGQGGMLGTMAMVKPWAAGESDSRGSGQGGPGRGFGGEGHAEEAPTQTDKTKANVKQQNGPIIGTRLVYGDQVRGESVAEFSAAVEVAAKSATDAIETMQIPREYHDAVKKYFGTLPGKIKTNTPSETPAPAPAPAGDGK